MTRPSVLVLACGALARELEAAFKVNRVDNVKVEYLSAALHNRPERICEMLRTRLASVRRSFDRVFLGYADCGTGGEIDSVCAEFDAQRLPGAHCYEFYLPPGAFNALHDEEPGTFYLTDFLATHFERLVVETLGIEKHPELLDIYFANYKRAVFISQGGSAKASAAAASAARRLGLPLKTIEAGWGQFGDSVAAFSEADIIGGKEKAGPALVPR